jgi:thioredoxin-related protein
MKMLVSILLFSWSHTVSAEKTFEANIVHKTIAAEKDWVGSTRALVPADLKGRILLLHFGRTQCSRCLKFDAELLALQKEFGADLTWIEVVADAELIEKSAALTLKVVDPDQSLAKGFGIKNTPGLMIVDPEGQIYSTYFGLNHAKDIKKDAQNLIGKYRKDLNVEKLPLNSEEITN